MLAIIYLLAQRNINSQPLQCVIWDVLMYCVCSKSDPRVLWWCCSVHIIAIGLSIVYNYYVYESSSHPASAPISWMFYTIFTTHFVNGPFTLDTLACGVPPVIGIAVIVGWLRPPLTLGVPRDLVGNFAWRHPVSNGDPKTGKSQVTEKMNKFKCETYLESHTCTHNGRPKGLLWDTMAT